MSSLIGGGATFGALQTIIGADISGALKGFKAAEVAGQKTATKLTAIGATMAKGFGLALAGIGIAATKMAVDFEKGMSKIGTLIPGQTERLEELGSAINEVRIRYGKAADDIQEGTFQVISAFGDSAETVGRLDVVARAAAAGFSTTQESLNLLSAVTKGYGDTSIEALNKVADLAFLTNKMGQTTFPELANSMGRVIPTAKVLNVAQSELFATFATLTGVTGNANEVSTQLAGVLRSLIKPTDGMKAALKELGFETGEQAIQTLGLQQTLDGLVGTTDGSTIAIGKLFRRAEAMTALFALTGAQSDKFTKSLKAMEGAGGEAAEAFKEIEKTSAFALSQMAQKLAVTTEEIGAKLLPALNSLMNVLGPLADLLLKIAGPVLDLFGGALDILSLAINFFTGQLDSMKEQADKSFDGIQSKSKETADAIIADMDRLDQHGLKKLKATLGRTVKEIERTFLPALQKALDLSSIVIPAQVGGQLIDPLNLLGDALIEASGGVEVLEAAIDDLDSTIQDVIEDDEKFAALLDKVAEENQNLAFHLLITRNNYLNTKAAIEEINSELKDNIQTGTVYIRQLADISKQFTTFNPLVLAGTNAFVAFALGIGQAQIAGDKLQKGLETFIDPKTFAADGKTFIEGFFGPAFVDGGLFPPDLIGKITKSTGPPFQLIGKAASDAFSSAFQQNFQEFSDFGKALAIGFGAAFSAKLKEEIGKLDISGIFGDLLGAFAPVIGNLISSGLSKIGSFLFGSGDKIDFAAERAKSMELLNDSFADFNDQLDDVLDGTEKWDQAFVDLFNSFKSNNLLEIDSVFEDIADAITSVGDEIEKTKTKLAAFPATLFDSRLALDGVKNALIAARAELIRIKEEVGKQFVQRTQGETIQEGKRRVESLGIAELELITLRHDKIAAEKALTKAIEEGKAAEVARARLSIANAERSIKAKLREIGLLKKGAEPTITRLGIVGLAGDNVGQQLAGREAFRELKRQINKAAEDNRISANEQAVILAQTSTEETALLALQLIEAQKAVLEAVRAVEREKTQIEVAKDQRRVLRNTLPLMKDRLQTLIDLQTKFNEQGVQFLGNKLDDIVRAIRDIPSFQAGSGGPVQQNQLAFIHAGETVVPAGQSTGGPMTINFVVNDQILQSVVVPTMQNEIDNGQTRFPTGTLTPAGLF